MAANVMSAVDAAKLLGVKPATLYAYVSRGLLRSEPGTNGRNVYDREDVERLLTRHEARRGHTAVAAGALRFGEPVLDTAVSGIVPQGPAYRGHLAVELAAGNTSFERVAELLWSGAFPENAVWQLHLPSPVLARTAKVLAEDAGHVGVLSVLVSLMGMHDRERLALSPEGNLQLARSLVRMMAASLALPRRRAELDRSLAAPSVAAAVLLALGNKGHGQAVAALNRALVLVADHELNPSSFAARVAAATGADVYACVQAGLSAFCGPKHGGACSQVEALVRETGTPERARQAILARAARGELVPGFGHPLYPHGDPRCPPLLEEAQALQPKNVTVRTLVALRDAMLRVSGARPTVDLGLVALCHALGLPEGAATGVFAVGRTAGWVAHALEQRESGQPLRPRARYTGPASVPAQKL